MPPPVLHIAEAPAADPDAWAQIAHALGDAPLALVIVLAAPSAPLAQIPEQLGGGAPVIGCTTAGEIGTAGYVEDTIIAIGLPARDFDAETLLIEDLAHLDPEPLISDLIRRRAALNARHPDWTHEFAFLLVDGLSYREDALTSVLATGLGPVPLFGGSAADGTRFLETLVLKGTRRLRNAAVVALVRTRCPIRVFKLDHLRPTATRMVVTDADPARRIVRQINAEPAALEYARLLGRDPAQLTPFTFAAHPVVVRVGGHHHVRAIRQVADNGDLVFYSAIAEGMVLTLAEPLDMEDHLRRELGALSAPTTPAAIIACDCVLRRMEAQEKQKAHALSQVLAAHRVFGFSTYGEQFSAMHVNQTLTGVAIYPPGTAP